MGGTKFSQEQLNAREVLVSSDITRLQNLASRDQQDLLGDGSSDGTVPVSAFSGPCSLLGIASTYQMTLAAAQAFFYNPTDSSLTVDDSPFEVVRWPSQALTFGNPAGSPRIDLVVATPAMVSADSQSRNILVDPVARTVTPQNVFKTNNPQATIAVVAGTPGGSPVPPAVPAGAVALFEVWVPTGAADATTFGVIPRLSRRAPFPWSTVSRIVSGLYLQWDRTVNPATTPSTVSIGFFGARHRILIDGELIDTMAVPTVTQDAGANNPFASAAPSTNDATYYYYAVGGRHCPQGSYDSTHGTGNAGGCPIAIVESLIAPNPSTGQPLTAITGPRGATTIAGAVYIGLGFVVANTTFRRACIMTDEFTIAMAQLESQVHVLAGTGYEGPIALVTRPNISSKALVQLSITTFSGGAARGATVVPDNGAGAAVLGFTGSLGVAITPAMPPSSPIASAIVVLPMQTESNTNFWVSTGNASDTVGLHVIGWAHEVNRIAAAI